MSDAVNNPMRFSFKVGDTTKTYTLLSSLPRETTKIVKCGALLENRMQCWRAGDYLVQEVKTEKVEGADGIDGGLKDTVNSFQLCRRHAIEQEVVDRKAAAVAEAERQSVIDDENINKTS